MTRPRVPAEEISMPALLRHARTIYGVAMRAALDGAGFDDVPRNGLYVIGGLALEEGAVPLAELIRQLRVSKQAAGQLVDTLVARGYLERAADPHDRRRLTVTLTERGRAAAKVQRVARAEIDARLLARVGPGALRHTRTVLRALIEMAPAHDSGEGDG
jgi:DNA-binding MarR family transcriptional regulator